MEITYMLQLDSSLSLSLSLSLLFLSPTPFSSLFLSAADKKRKAGILQDMQAKVCALRSCPPPRHRSDSVHRYLRQKKRLTRETVRCEFLTFDVEFLTLTLSVVQENIVPRS